MGRNKIVGDKAPISSERALLNDGSCQLQEQRMKLILSRHFLYKHNAEGNVRAVFPSQRDSKYQDRKEERIQGEENQGAIGSCGVGCGKLWFGQ